MDKRLLIKATNTLVLFYHEEHEGTEGLFTRLHYKNVMSVTLDIFYQWILVSISGQLPDFKIPESRSSSLEFKELCG